jgi:hypothetical protein
MIAALTLAARGTRMVFEEVGPAADAEAAVMPGDMPECTANLIESLMTGAAQPCRHVGMPDYVGPLLLFGDDTTRRIRCQVCAMLYNRVWHDPRIDNDLVCSCCHELGAGLCQQISSPGRCW